MLFGPALPKDSRHSGTPHRSRENTGLSARIIRLMSRFDRDVSRRAVLPLLPVAAAWSCAADQQGRLMPNQQSAERSNPQSNAARLSSRPASVGSRPQAGLHQLGLSDDRDALLYVPVASANGEPAPLVVSLHGAGGHAQHGIDLLRRLADERGFVLLSPPSRSRTWDIILGRYGPDVQFVNRALAEAFQRCPIDPQKIAVAGFSDGASYALSLGLANGSFLTSILAYSPGFMAPPLVEGSPAIFISHGTGDRVLPIDQCSRRIVRLLRQANHQVLYREFDGPHTIPQEVAAEGVAMFLNPVAR